MRGWAEVAAGRRARESLDSANQHSIGEAQGALILNEGESGWPRWSNWRRA
jgi:hypothetical protein